MTHKPRSGSCASRAWAAAVVGPSCAEFTGRSCAGRLRSSARLGVGERGLDLVESPSAHASTCFRAGARRPLSTWPRPMASRRLAARTVPSRSPGGLFPGGPGDGSERFEDRGTRQRGMRSRRRTRSRRDRPVASCMAVRIASHGRRTIHSSMPPKGRTIVFPSCASHRGALSGALRSSTTQRPPRGEGRGAVGDDIAAFRHVRQGVGGQDRVDLGREVELGRVCLHEADVVSSRWSLSDAGLGRASRRSDRRRRSGRPGPIACSISEKFRPVPQAMSTTVSPGRSPSACTARRRWARCG